MRLSDIYGEVYVRYQDDYARYLSSCHGRVARRPAGSIVEYTPEPTLWQRVRHRARELFNRWRGVETHTAGIESLV